MDENLLQTKSTHDATVKILIKGASLLKTFLRKTLPTVQQWKLFHTNSSLFYRSQPSQNMFETLYPQCSSENFFTQTLLKEPAFSEHVWNTLPTVQQWKLFHTNSIKGASFLKTFLKHTLPMVQQWKCFHTNSIKGASFSQNLFETTKLYPWCNSERARKVRALFTPSKTLICLARKLKLCSINIHTF